MARAEPNLRLGRHATAAFVVVAVVAAMAIVLAPGGRRAHAAGDRCGLREPGAVAAWRLPHVAQRIRTGGTLTIVALGSSSTFGSGASRPANAYPSRLAVLLARRLSGLELRVLNRGVGGEEADAMAARIERDAIAVHPDLVIWQVGTNGVLRDRDPEAIGRAVRDGIARMRRAGADVVLMDVQFAPAVLRHERYHDMLRRLDAIAYADAVPLFPRFAIMRHWVEDGRMTLPAMLSRDRLHMTDRSYDCLARLVTAGIAAGATPGLKA
jgi:acyl-CoA thioesterase I